MKRISFFAAAGLYLVASDVFAQEWGNIATVSETTPGYLCAHDPDATGDDQIDCSTLSPYVATDGDIGIGTSAPSRTLTVSGTTWTHKIGLSMVADAAVPVSVATEASAEIDPKVGSLGVSGQWCTTDGSTINCTSDAPSASSDNLGDHTATTTLDMANQNITNAQAIAAQEVTADNVSLTGVLQVSGDSSDECTGHGHKGKIRVDPATGNLQICRWWD